MATLGKEILLAVLNASSKGISNAIPLRLSSSLFFLTPLKVNVSKSLNTLCAVAITISPRYFFVYLCQILLGLDLGDHGFG
jgi:hypothetical protein